ncbi:band 7 protein AGAP004871 isoform X2 [Acanthochromis polyacanthus]|uniref:band 7 protein AGAP004871 isoform X2 n=1 Tax=Acanthochromis polyacanthus TaxID=80966 RepID=UPI002234E642|nr:band 7 protein AGAP004871 isoform X2 [Acanthochromis polyacanthus]
MPGFNRVGVLCADEFDADTGKNIASDGGRRSSGAVEVFGAVLTLLSVAFILLTFPLTAWMCAQVVQEYESAVIFRLGRAVKGRAKGPGLLWFIPWLDVIRKVDLRTVSFNVRPQEVLTADGVPLMVDAVVFFRVVDPSLWVMQVQNGYQATVTLAQTTLRATLGANTLMDVLTHRPGIAKRMEEVLYGVSRLWGVRVERVELKDLTLPVSLQRCMAAEAEAARTARAKMILAEGEVKASRALMEATSGLSSVAFHLRYLQSMSSVPSGASVVVCCLPLSSSTSSFPSSISSSRASELEICREKRSTPIALTVRQRRLLTGFGLQR